jgi:hypothetical protein
MTVVKLSILCFYLCLGTYYHMNNDKWLSLSKCDIYVFMAQTKFNVTTMNCHLRKLIHVMH